MAPVAAGLLAQKHGAPWENADFQRFPHTPPSLHGFQGAGQPHLEERCKKKKVKKIFRSFLKPSVLSSWIWDISTPDTV